MKCEECLKYIDDFIEGEIEGQNAEQINVHLFDCSECTAVYETLNREKNLYAQYLFEVEAPTDLWVKFQTKLEAEKDSRAAQKVGWFSEWVANASGFLRFNPFFSSAALLVLIALGFGWLKYTPENESAAKTETADMRSITAKSDETKKMSFPPKSRQEENEIVSPKISKSDKASTGKTIARIETKSVAVKIQPAEERLISVNRKKISEDNEFTEEVKLHRFQAVNLEKETVRQVEKTELLLRAFRNTQFDERGETFDVAYEKEQAKKLLEKNILLRQNAANFGTFRAEEMLSQIEPYLLDISNLENKPSRDKILDIKERVKNQNIIASLQTY